MSIKLYIDENVHAGISSGLRNRQVDVITVQEDCKRTYPDPELLDRAAALDRVFFTQDADLLEEASMRQRTGIPFQGVIFGQQNNALIGRYIADLELICKCCDMEEFVNRVEYLPLS